MVANGYATLLFDLLTAEEDMDYSQRFNINLLTDRLTSVTSWMKSQPEYSEWEIGYFGASTGAASALMAAAAVGPDVVKAVVSRGGRPDMAVDVLSRVQSPTLLLVGGLDTEVIKLNRQAYDKLECERELVVIPGASHLFEESGKLEQVTRHANHWFLSHLYQHKSNAKENLSKQKQ